MPSSLTVLFWNVQKKDLSENIGRMARKYSVDIIVLAETAGSLEDLRATLAEHTGGAIFYVNLPKLPSKTQLFSRHPSSRIKPRYTNSLGRLSIFEVDIPLVPRLLLATVHLLPIPNSSEETINEEAKLVADELRSEVSKLDCGSYLVCGDFNQNPFHKSMNGAGYFHAVMHRQVAMRRTRKIQTREYGMLYNPMWSLIGDYPNRPGGTHFHSPALHETTHWHVVDQFLISPDLLDLSSIGEVSILTGDGQVDFLSSNGMINEALYSDHLPILLRLDFNNE